MHSKEVIYHNQKINGINMGQMLSKRNLYQSQCPNIEDYHTFYGSTQMCTYYARLVIWMTANPHHVMFLLGDGVISWNNKK
jgi:hypothetical protein